MVAPWRPAAAQALSKLRPGGGIKLVYAYRHPEVQSNYHSYECSKIVASEPGLPIDVVRDRAHMLSAYPPVAGHPTGGAVDVTIQVEGVELDMGTLIDTDAEADRIPVFSETISAEQRANRMLLRRVMLESGFASFDGEWWHFCYGDREWAAYVGAAGAVYDQVTIE